MNRKQVTLDMKETMYQQLCRMADERGVSPGHLLADAIKGWLLSPRKDSYMSNREGLPDHYPVSYSSLHSMSRAVTDPTPNNPYTMRNSESIRPPDDYDDRDNLYTVPAVQSSYTDEQLNHNRYADIATGRTSDHYQDGIVRTATIPGTKSDYEIQEIKRRNI